MGSFTDLVWTLTRSKPVWTIIRVVMKANSSHCFQSSPSLKKKEIWSREVRAATAMGSLALVVISTTSTTRALPLTLLRSRRPRRLLWSRWPRRLTLLRALPSATVGRFCGEFSYFFSFRSFFFRSFFFVDWEDFVDTGGRSHLN